MVIEKPLPYSRQLIDDDDIDAVVAALRSNWLTTGPMVDDFENAIAEAVDARFAVACSNGTAALHIAALAINLGEGDVVVVPSITFLASANIVRLVGAEVVFADVDPGTGLMTVDTLSEAIKRGKKLGKVRAAIPVHMRGQSCDMTALKVAAERENIILLEDAAHALGALAIQPDGEAVPVGACRDAAVAAFSFHPVKSITTGEGGAATTNDPSIADRLRLFRNHGMTRDPQSFRNAELALDDDGCVNPWHYEMSEIGLNYRLTDLQSALGLSQLAKLDSHMLKRRALADAYDEALAPLAPLIRPAPRAPNCVSAWHLYSVEIDFTGAAINRSAVMAALRDRGIGTQVHYIPVHRQPYYMDRYGYTDLRGAEAYYTSTLSVPLFVEMEPTDVHRVAQELAAAVGVVG